MPANASWGQGWRRITRFLESSRIAFEREHLLLDSLSLTNTGQVSITVPTGKGKYSVRLQEHLSATGDEETLFAAVLILSYAFAEAVANSHLGLVPPWPQIEAWGKQLLNKTDKGWTDVHGGLKGAVEVAVVRNTLAHGSSTISPSGAARLSAVKLAGRPVGSKVTVSHADIREYRARLLSLLRVGRVP